MAAFATSLKLNLRLQVATPTAVQVRYRKIQSRRIREPHFDRKALLEACKPVFPRDTTPSWQKCRMIDPSTIVHPPHPYNKIMSEKLRDELHSAGLICFFHVNSILAEDKRKAHNLLFKKGFFLKSYNNATVRLAITGTKFESAMPFTYSRNALVISETPDVKTLLRLIKKIPQFILLAGIAYNRFLSREQLQWLSTIPDIKYLQGQTCALLSSSASALYGATSHQQSRLSQLLSSHAKGQEGQEKNEG